jgi:UDP-glucose 4-epimerase
MGMTKALEEKDSLYFSKNAFNSTIFCIVRYGNVMGSRGSILNVFYEKAKVHKILPLTDENMERFFLSLPESTDLVLYALKNGEQGDLFIKKAPSCFIRDLAKAVIQLTDSNSAISIVGNRSGDKLFEYLATSEEMNNATDLGEYFKINNLRSLTDQVNFYRHPKEDMAYTTKVAVHLDQEALVSKIKSLLPLRNE